MTAFLISDLLDNATRAVLATDNAAGHGKRVELERRRQRHHARIQSQRPCRKPTRTADDHEDIEGNECNSSLSPILSRGRLSHTSEYCMEKLSLRAVDSPSVQDLWHSGRSKFPTLPEFKVESHKPTLPHMVSPHNACKPRRRASIDAFEPIAFADEHEEEQSPSQDISSCRQPQQLDGTAVSLLQDILSSIDL